MGYRSTFVVSVPHGEVSLQELADEIYKESDYQFEVYDDDLYITGDDWKWYDCEKDMKKVSKKYPGTLILVEVNGEEDHDLWQLYCHGGKTERIDAKTTVVYAESKLLKEFEAHKEANRILLTEELLGESKND